MIETKVIVCRYGKTKNVIDENSSFGWQLDYKVLLNRFGNPVPNGVQYSQSDLMEKCSYQLHLKRIVDESKVGELTRLQNEYDSFDYLNDDFGGGRITGSIFISIACLFIFLAAAFWEVSNATRLVLVALGLFVGSPIPVIFATGASRKARASNKNKEIHKQKELIKSKALEVLKKPE